MNGSNAHLNCNDFVTINALINEEQWNRQERGKLALKFTWKILKIWKENFSPSFPAGTTAANLIFKSKITHLVMIVFIAKIIF